eukprot:TRINITY_DN78424_c0_g1_i1.p1 TRINITY_DN78424_c0_g1~~TRINITY_DN78424_c0_g1_i1.p1  ORF type:complete len:106 (+),score=8.61 TRINITY_DN78424_c0_g1_i1:91-408(+)
MRNKPARISMRCTGQHLEEHRVPPRVLMQAEKHMGDPDQFCRLLEQAREVAPEKPMHTDSHSTSPVCNNAGRFCDGPPDLLAIISCGVLTPEENVIRQLLDVGDL